MLELEFSQSGKHTVNLKGLYLHSRYDPERESRRFVAGAIGRRSPSVILLLGAGLGYVIKELRQRFPGAKVLPVFYDRAIFSACRSRVFLPVFWHPARSEPLIAFLRANVHELEAEGLAVIEWPPSSRIYGVRSLQANRAVNQLLKELRGSLATTSALGRRWLKNSFINFAGLERLFPLPPAGLDKPIVIAASGPSLAESVKLIRLHRSGINLWALPSSLLFLLENGLTPDLTVLTDPAYYAFTHLRCAASRSLHLAMPLSAAAGAWRLGARVSVLNQGTFFERALLAGTGIEAPTIPPQGTVAASAMELAVRSGSEPIIFAGLDFCFRDILSHVRPNSFEHWLLPAEQRLCPMYHLIFSRAAELANRRSKQERGNLALATYAGWFANLNGHTGRRVARLHPSEVELPDVPEIDASQFAELAGRQRREPPQGPEPEPVPAAGQPERAERLKIALNLLQGWIRRAQQIRQGIRRTGKLDEFLNDSEQLSLSYFCDAAAVVEMRRILRLKGETAAAGRVQCILERQSEHLAELATKLA
jgi:hypothetical protein